mgnify:CR=1 FL=1
MARIAHAADSIKDLVFKINEVVINPLILLMFAVAIVVFLYGVFRFITTNKVAGKDVTGFTRDQGKSHIMWGLIGIFIMIAVYAIMNLILGTLGIDGVNVESGEVDLGTIAPDSVFGPE